MRNLIIFGLLILLLLTAQFASAKTVEEVIEKYIRARGGWQKLEAVKSIFMEGDWLADGSLVPVKITKEQGVLSYTELNDGLSKEVILITGKAARQMLQSGDQPTVATDLDPLLLQSELDINGPLVGYERKGYKAELLGKEVVEGNRCYKIRLTSATGFQTLYWIDASSYLLNQASVMKADLTGQLQPVINIYRNYRDVDGIKFAHTCETHGAKATGQEGEMTFHQILLNPFIDTNQFFPE